MKIYPFDKLSNCDLIIDAVYEGGNNGNVGDDPLTKYCQLETKEVSGMQVV